MNKANAAVSKQTQQQKIFGRNNFPKAIQTVSPTNVQQAHQISHAYVLELNSADQNSVTTQKTAELPFRNIVSILLSLLQSINIFTTSMVPMMQKILKIQSTVFEAILN